MAVPIPRSAALQSGGPFENILSALVVAAAVAFLVFMLVRTGTGHLGSYPMTILLPDAAGLKLGTDVRLGGVKVGSVTGLALDSDYNAVVQVRVRDDLALPVDSSAGLASPVMGDVYLALKPGRAGKTVPAGGELSHPRPIRHHAAAGT
jgi:phospholipid/cholesterol/gamma-HCH transport system substrate-binding protein